MSRKQRDHMCDEEAILQIHRLFRDPLPADEDLCPWYCPPGGLVDCNALLSVEEDSEFIEAAIWQIHGHETAGRQRQRWLRRLKRTSRMSLILGMRYKCAGRRREVRIPGLWLALLFDPPLSHMWSRGYVGRLVNGLRHKIVAWRYQRCVHNSPVRSAHQGGAVKARASWRRASW